MQKEQHPASATLLDHWPKTNKKTNRYKKSGAVNYLETLYLERKRERFPHIPPAYLTINGYRDDTANGLTKCIISFIQLMGGQAERISTTGRPIDRTKTYIDVIGRKCTIGRLEWIPGTSTKGSADISATIAGRSVKIEVKIGRDRQSQAQKDYQSDITKAGGVYFIAQNFEEFLTWYNLNFRTDGPEIF